MSFNFAPNWKSAKYTLAVKGDEGNDYTVEIHRDTYDKWVSGSNTLVGSTRDSIVTSWDPSDKDEYSPFVFSQTTLAIYDGGEAVASDLIGAINEVEDLFLIVVRDGDDLKWIGKIDPEGITFDEDGPVQLQIIAADGLGRLDNTGYNLDENGLRADSEVVSLMSIVADILNDTGFGLDSYVSTSFYPKVTPSLGATDNPLENIYIDKLAFLTDDGKGTRSAVSKLTVLRTICQAFGIKCFQADGAWHLIQANHLHVSSYRRWRYDSTGTGKIANGENIGSGTRAVSPSGVDYEDVTPSVTPTNEDRERTTSTASFLTGYNSVEVQYKHGPVNIWRSSRFEPLTREEAESMLGGTYPWDTTGGASIYPFFDGSSGMGVNVVDANPADVSGYSIVSSGIVNATDAGGGEWDFISAGGVAEQTTPTISSLAELGLAFQVFGLTGSENPPRQRVGDDWVAIQVVHNGSSTQYLSATDTGDFTWGATENWILLENFVEKNGWVSKKFGDIEALPSDGSVTVRLGPIIHDETGAGELIWSKAVWDNVELVPVLADGTQNNTATSSINYISRTNPRPRSLPVMIGDGPTVYNRGTMFVGPFKINGVTGNWEESTSGHSGASTGDNHFDVLGRAILTSTNAIRRVHSASYPNIGHILTPLDVLSRDGSLYPAWRVDLNWTREFSSGSWYKSDENGFTDDLVTGIDNGTGSAGDFGRGMSGDSSFLFSQMEQVFNSENSKRLTRTTESIPAGATTADVDVEVISQALLNSNDTIVMISPDLSVYKLKLTQDQPAGAATLYFDDPANPGSNYDFPVDVPSGANIFLADDDTLTLVRLGEQGFKVTVLGQPLGKVDGAQSGTLTQLTVKDWIVSVPSGTTIALDDGTELTLSADVNPSDTTIYFNSTSVNASDDEEVVSGSLADLSVTAAQVAINVSDISGNTGNISVNSGNISTNVTNISTNNGGILANTGLINVESGRIDLQIERSEDSIGVITSASSGTTLTLSGGINDDLFDGDSVLIIDKSTGTIQKREVASDAAQFATSFTVTSAVTVAVDDVVHYGVVAGLRVDFDGISVLNTHLKSNWNGVVNSSGVITTPGTTGWIITNQGNAEFNNVSIRGELDVSDIVGDLTVTDGSIIVNMDDTVTGATKLPLSFYDENGATDVLTWSYNPYVTNIDWVMYNSNEAGVLIFQAQNSGSNQADLSLWPAGLTTITNSVSWVEANDSLIINGSVFSGDQDDRFALMSMGKPSYYEYHLAGYGTSSFYTKTSNTTVANTVTKTSLIGTGSGTNTIPADALATGSTIRVTAGGAYSSSAGNTLNLTIDIDGTTVFSRPVSFSSAVSGYGWTFDSLVTVRSDTTAISSGSLIYNDSTGGQLSANNTTTTTTISSVSGGTSVVTLNATWTTADASSSVTCSNLNIEVHRAN
jgi:hypothetical protein